MKFCQRNFNFKLIMSKRSAFLLWDVTSCQSQTVDSIREMSTVLNHNYDTIFVFAEDVRQICPAINDLMITLKVVLRFGESAIYDIIVDVIKAITSAEKKFHFDLVSNRLSLWFSLFQQIQPSSLTIISSKDPRDDFDFTFLPTNTQCKLYKWPSIEQLEGPIESKSQVTHSQIEYERYDDDDDDEYRKYIQTQEQQQQNLMNQIQGISDEVEEDEGDRNSTYPQSPYTNVTSPNSSPYKNEYNTVNDASNRVSSPTDSSEPVKRHTLKSKSKASLPLQQSQQTVEHSRNQHQAPSKSRGNQVNAGNKDSQVYPNIIPVEFKPLFESMKACGKSMISLHDLEASFNRWCSQYTDGGTINLMSLINKASEANYVIFDKSINYIRFRDRTINTAQIQYD